MEMPSRRRSSSAWADAAVGAHAVAPQPLGVGQLQHAGETAVVREQQQPLGADVEPADAHQPRQARRQGVEHRGPALRVGVGGHEADRLVVEEEPRALALRQRLAVDGDAVARGDVDCRRRDRLAVDGDPAGGDPVLGIAARAHAGARHHLGDAVAVARCVACGRRSGVLRTGPLGPVALSPVALGPAALRPVAVGPLALGSVAFGPVGSFRTVMSWGAGHLPR